MQPSNSDNFRKVESALNLPDLSAVQLIELFKRADSESQYLLLSKEISNRLSCNSGISGDASYLVNQLLDFLSSEMKAGREGSRALSVVYEVLESLPDENRNWLVTEMLQGESGNGRQQFNRAAVVRVVGLEELVPPTIEHFYASMLTSDELLHREAACKEISVGIDQMSIEGRTEDAVQLFRKVSPALFEVLFRPSQEEPCDSDQLLVNQILQQAVEMFPEELVATMVEAGADLINEEDGESDRLSSMLSVLLDWADHRLENLPDILKSELCRDDNLNMFVFTAFVNYGERGIQYLLDAIHSCSNGELFDRAIQILPELGAEIIDEVLNYCNENGFESVEFGLICLTPFFIRVSPRRFGPGSAEVDFRELVEQVGSITARLAQEDVKDFLEQAQQNGGPKVKRHVRELRGLSCKFVDAIAGSRDYHG